MTRLRYRGLAGKIANFVRDNGLLATKEVFAALTAQNDLYLFSTSWLPPSGNDRDAPLLGQRPSQLAEIFPGQLPALRWPDVESMLGDDFKLTLSRRLKYKMRLLSTSAARQRLLEECALTPFGRVLLGTRPRALYPLMNHLLDRRLGAEERLNATVAGIRTICDRLAEPQQHRLLAQDLTLITLEDGTRLTIGLNGVSFHEGILQVGLVLASGTRLYSLGFGFKDARTILIANVQGPSLGVDGLAIIREVTRLAHGMRPPHLLLHALRRVAAHWHVDVLHGVDPKNHIKGRWNLRHSRLRFNYRAFWIEGGANRHEGGNWNLPLALEFRPLAEVPSKRRAMYRRRYAMLAQIDYAIAELSR